MPLFSTFHVLVNISSGLKTVPAGMVSSRINARLLQPNASVDGLGVGVYCVPVGEGERLNVETPGLKTIPCVDVAMGEDNAIAVFVGWVVDVDVGDGVADKACAVCVWKTDAENVPTLEVRIAFISNSGCSVAGCPPHAARNSTAIRMIIFVLFLELINTSVFLGGKINRLDYSQNRPAEFVMETAITLRNHYDRPRKHSDHLGLRAKSD